MSDVRVHSIGERPRPTRGVRVLVERSLPVTWARAPVRPDVWFPALAPSASLRQRYPATEWAFGEFADRYAAELDEPGRQAQYQLLRDLAADGPVVLLVSASPAHLTHAAVLACRLRRPVRAARPPEPEGGDPACWAGLVCPECGRIPDASTAVTCWSCQAVTAG
ncbi:DUF488 domain-containing protein [Streptantibioticus rubrisoli]|uniref:DUF488 family protein n=1 Tax=Streptantibioticus rubrisoli TaxID=1387313 RepID=A0ABT1P7V1_9ACTN|nr:DUF488 family protein [Streptantibioticus rubrisoli]MCQ4041438.1 DUF488 family protein [Streptantibioticus rubrisoli]